MHIKPETNRYIRSRNIPSTPYIFEDETRGYIQSVEYNRPVTLKKALYDIKQSSQIDEGVAGDKPIVQRFIDDLNISGKILNKKIVKMLGSGSSAIAFETPDGKVIKITDGRHVPFDRPMEAFDVPVFKKGKCGKTHFYIEEKLLQHNMPDYLVEIVRNKIILSGYRTYDLYRYDLHQIGISAQNGDVYLLDPECARYKTVFHAMFDKAIRLMKKIKF